MALIGADTAAQERSKLEQDQLISRFGRSLW
jgi:hypothetical protein